MARILLVDDEPSILNVLSTLMKSEGHESVAARGGEMAQEVLLGDRFDLMISDIRMAPVDGLQLLKTARHNRPEMAVIMLTAYGSVETAVNAMKEGAFDYVTKPFKVDELLMTVQRALEYTRVHNENEDLRRQLETRYQFENIVAESPAMRRVCEIIGRVARTDATVLITGESGTGKELVAQAIHAHSARKGRRFLPINCAALPEPLLESEMFGHVKGAFTGAVASKEGLFEAASGGTIFLDEIGAMPAGIQAKLLRVLQDRQVRRVGSNDSTAVDVRVIAATNDKLEELIKTQAFREDLYYRLSVIPIELAPLRERREDIQPLFNHFLRHELRANDPMPSVDPAAAIALERYDWPGNVRELQNAARHALAFANEGVIQRDDLPVKILNAVSALPAEDVLDSDMKGRSLRFFLRAKEREYLSQVLKSFDGDKEQAAKALNISLATLYRKLPDAEE
ncbi:MAG: sigma-54-dependent Fis family transcriptional regulator [Verrucomicrobia bacterium]|nr:sigma-54 dependent transcriptional regulator [Kiritimatiellia bacterium]MCO6399826.1 sigma-54-dependent Fis family transcriptional regulator [Verrucomicrobiota bacterium]